MNKLIKIKENYYVIDDSEIKEGYVFNTFNNTIYQIVPNNSSRKILERPTNLPLCAINNEHYFKITHSTQKLNNVILLNKNDIEELLYGYSVEKLAENYAKEQCEDLYNKESLTGESWGWETALDYKKGFEAHKNLSKDKLFTVDDLKNAFKAGNEGNGGSMYNRVKKYNDFDNYVTKELGFVWDIEKGYILLPPTEWNIEIQNSKIILV